MDDRRIDRWYWVAIAFLIVFSVSVVSVILVAKKQRDYYRWHLNQLNEILEKHKEQVINVKYLK